MDDNTLLAIFFITLCIVLCVYLTCDAKGK